MCSLFLQKQSQISDENDECYYFFKYTLSKQRYQTYKPKSIFLYGSLRYPKLWRAVSKLIHWDHPGWPFLTIPGVSTH